MICETVEKIIITAIGSLLGFLFGIGIIYIKDYRDKKNKILVSKKLLYFYANTLVKLIVSKPSDTIPLKFETIFSYYDVIASNKQMVSDFDDIYMTYIQWRIGSLSQSEKLYTVQEEKLKSIVEKYKDLNNLYQKAGSPIRRLLSSEKDFP
ncbi:MAG: hypothetical protein FJ264_11590 [Planctomycetes bacterium]|nr:hypothetical protein [Planctomycetota bacterium]